MKSLKLMICLLGLGLFSFYHQDVQKEDVSQKVAEIHINVHIEGEVIHPDDYVFDHVIHVQEALNEAGLLDSADIHSVGLNMDIYPGMLIYVPKQQEGKLSLNEASVTSLQSINGIGPAKAQAIVDGRPFSCLEDLMKVKGFGEKSYLKYRDLFTL